MKKIIALLLALTIVFGLVACANDTTAEQPQAPAAKEEAAPAEPGAEAPAEAPTEKQKLTISVLMGADPEKPELQCYLDWVKAAYETWELKDQVELEILENYSSSNDYLTKIQLEMSDEKTCPDIVWEDSFQLTADVAAGYIADITPYVTEWETWNNGSLIDSMKNQVTISGAVYGMPSTTDVRGMIYNKNVLVAAGVLSSLEEDWQPTTWEELLNDLRAIRDNTDAIPFWSPMSAAEGEGTSMHNFENWFYATGEELMYNDDGNWNLDTTAWETAVGFLHTVVNEGLTMPTAQLLDASPGSYALPAFQNDEMGVILHNTSQISKFAPGAANEMTNGNYLDCVGIAAVPTVNGDGAKFATMSGGLCWAVPALSDQQELGAKFLMQMMDPDLYCKFIVAYNRMTVMDLSAYPEYTERDFAQDSADLVPYTHFRPHHETYASVSTCIYQMVENIATGMSVEDALEIFRADAEFAISN